MNHDEHTLSILRKAFPDTPVSELLDSIERAKDQAAYERARENISSYDLKPTLWGNG